MIADPKPTPRAKKTPKPITLKRAKPRRVPKNHCVDADHPRCKRLALHIGRCGTHADEYLYKLRRAIVVTDRCELQDWHAMTNTRCNGPLQDNHGISRGYTRANLTFDPANGFSGCGGANKTAHYRQLEWTEFLKKRWGKEEYARRLELALHGPKLDYDKALADLRDRDGN